jgi:adenylate kinase family enzyme
MFRRAERLSDVVIIDGPPGSGKGFLSGRYLADNPATQHISAGQQIRGIRSGDIESIYTPTVLAHLEARAYLPDEVFGGIILEEMTRKPEVIDLTLVDGFPHVLGDLDYVQEKLGEEGRRILGAVSLDATLDTCLFRMSYRGMRQGEDVRKGAVFSESESEREYYAGRYQYYLDARNARIDMLLSRGLQLEQVDVNPNILDDDIRRVVYGQFANSINTLRIAGADEE